MPMDRSKYPPDWEAISLEVRAAADNRCQDCQVRNGSVGARDKAGLWWSFDRIDATSDQQIERWFGEYPKLVKIVLTVAHLDHDPGNSDRANLRALCQRCHLNYDRPRHLETQRQNRLKRSGQQQLL